MNILITNDDGVKAYGLEILRAAVKAKWPRANAVVLAPKGDASSCGFGMKNPIPGATGGLARLKPKKVETRVYEGPPGYTPVDLVNHAFLAADQYISNKRPWDLVLSGVNHGRNVGLGILTSGTVAAAVYAAAAFDVPAWAFSQDLPDKFPKKPDAAEHRAAYRNAVRYLRQFFDNNQPTHSPTGGECMSVNFPRGDHSQGWMNCEVARYAPWVGPAFTPHEAKKRPADVEFLAQGYVTIAEVELSLNPPMRF